MQCPVCTLYLHNGMTLESHLDTHPKDQVIKALCCLTTNKGSTSSYGSRTSTPMHSERSYRSRSRTPANDERWPSSHRSSDNERYWRRTPSRASKSSQILSNSRNGTPDIRIGDINFENNINNSSQFSGSSYPIKSDKTQQTYPNIPTVGEFEQPYVYYQDSNGEDREIKYSRSAEYTPIDGNTSVFTHKTRSMTPGVKLQTLLPTVPRGTENLVKMLPKPNNILVKTNMGGVQYIGPGGKPMHVMMPAAPTFVQKNVQNSMIMASGIPGTTMVDKNIAPTLPTTQFNQLTSSTFTPGTTVVQNSQFIYREMVHNIDGKRFISCVPSVLSHENVTNVAQGTSMYQNVMVVDQLGNAPCMYSTSQPVVPKPCAASVYTDSLSHIPSSTTAHIEKAGTPSSDSNKTLIIEVGPIVPPTPQCEVATTTHHNITTQTDIDITKPSKVEALPLDKFEKNETPGSSKGLKILSNIKVEVPVQHHKNMLNTVMDLTGSNEPEYPDRSVTPEKILPDLDNQTSDDCTQPSISSSDSIVSHSFSVIKNVGNPPSYKDTSTKSSVIDSKIDTDFSDSCPVLDLICNEKPSISPCSELSESGENSTDRTLTTTMSSPRPQLTQPSSKDNTVDKKKIQQRTYRQNTLRLNNIFVKKHKKILQIKNVKPLLNSTNSSQCGVEPRPSSSTCRSPENYSMNKIIDRTDREKLNSLQTITVERITVTEDDDNDHHDFDADTEEQSMDLEPTAPSSLNNSDQFTTSIDVVQVKEEINTSNEEGYSNEDSGNRELAPLESLRPINVITYGNMPPGDFDEESNHRELLELEASKNNKFVSMMNENYFGDNIYADYFTPDRVEAFDSERASTFPKDGPKDGMYMWGAGEPSHKESEFVLPNFIHESYKIADSSGVDYSDIGGREEAVEVEVDGCERDSKADVLSESRSEGEAPLNICADERMPPRGELSGQESNGDMESAWNGVSIFFFFS